MESSFRPRRAPTLGSLVGAMLAFALLTPVSAAASPGDVPSCGPQPLVAPASAPPLGTAACPGVRPGAYVVTPEGGCTLNFVFRVRETIASGTRTVRYAGTAGHCALPVEGETSWSANQGPRAYIWNGSQNDKIGEFVYAVNRTRGLIRSYRDFALIRLDADVESRAGMCHFGGPTGINAEIHDRPLLLHHYGQGLGFGGTIPARTSVARGLQDPDVAGATGAINYGDSGSGVISEDGRAVGVIVHFVDEEGPDVIGITRLRPQIWRAERVLGVDMTLLTAPLN